MDDKKDVPALFQPFITPQGARIIAISYRDKEIVREGVVIEKRPTMVRIIEEGKKTEDIRLPDEDYEMCFLRAERREIMDADGEITVIDFAGNGIRAGDIVLMVMGGSGSFWAYALSIKLEMLGSGGVYWIGSTLFKRLCDEHKLDRSKVKDVDDAGRRTEETFDHEALPKVFAVAANQFHRVAARERDLILLQDVYKRRIEAMGSRMACAQRVRQRLKKMAYCVQDGYPEGGVKLYIEQGLANDKIFLANVDEEKKVTAELKKLLHTLPVWNVFEPIEGVGELTAAALIVAIQDVNRFPGESQLKAFLGVHTLRLDGTKFPKGEKPTAGNSKFARRRQGQLSNWNDEGRQALYLIADQFCVWKQKSPWGLVAKEVKRRWLVKHPTPQCWVKDGAGYVIEKVDLPEGQCKRIRGGWKITLPDGSTREVKGTTKFNPGHINRMQAWRTITLFVEWLFRAWKATEAGRKLPKLPLLPIAVTAAPDAEVSKAA
jgi:Transposase IS116/IS110/IS902 family